MEIDSRKILNTLLCDSLFRSIWRQRLHFWWNFFACAKWGEPFYQPVGNKRRLKKQIIRSSRLGLQVFRYNWQEVLTIDLSSFVWGSSKGATRTALSAFAESGVSSVSGMSSSAKSRYRIVSLERHNVYLTKSKWFNKVQQIRKVANWLIPIGNNELNVPKKTNSW